MAAKRSKEPRSQCPKAPRKPCRRKSALHQCRQECQSRRQPPSAKNIAIHRLVTEEGLVQRKVAERFGISQPRVCTVVKQVNEWAESTIESPEATVHSPQPADCGAPEPKNPTLTPAPALHPLPGPNPNPDPTLSPSPPSTLREVLEKELAWLDSREREVREQMALAQQPYDASVVTIKDHAEEVWTKKDVRRQPPRVGWQSLLTRIGKDRAKVEKALVECEAKESQVPSPMSKVGGEETQVADKNDFGSGTLDVGLAPAATLSAAAGRTCSCTAKGRSCPCVKSLDKQLCAPCRKAVARLRPVEGARHWCYQALGVRQELREDDREGFVTMLIAIDELAENADAMARAEARSVQDGLSAECRMESAELRNFRQLLRGPVQ